VVMPSSSRRKLPCDKDAEGAARRTTLSAHSLHSSDQTTLASAARASGVRETIGAVIGKCRVVGPGQLVLGLGLEHPDQRGRVDLAARHLALLRQALDAAKHV